MCYPRAVELVRDPVVESLGLHPRVKRQGLAEAREVRERLVSMLPKIVPFRGRTLHRVVAVLDWDHRLPSRTLTLRLHGLYDAKGLERLESAWADRTAEIQRK